MLDTEETRVKVSRLPSLALPALFAAAAWLALGQTTVLIRQMQQEGVRAFGIEALGGGWLPAVVTENARQAVGLWSAENADNARVLLYAYTLVDTFVFIPAYVWLILTIFRRSTADWERQPQAKSTTVVRGLGESTSDSGTRGLGIRLLATLVLADVLENLCRILAFETRASAFWVGGAYVAEKVKWLALAAVLLIVLAAVLDLWAEPKIGEQMVRRLRNNVKEVANGQRSAVATLRALVVIAVAFAALLLVDVTGQASDLVRRMADGGVDTTLAALAGLAATVLLALVLWASCRRIILADQRPQPPAESRPKPPARPAESRRIGPKVLAITVAVAFGAGLLGWRGWGSRNVMGAAIVALLVLVLEGVRRVLNWASFAGQDTAAINQTKRALAPPDELARPALQRTARFIALIPVAALGLAMVKAATSPLVLSAAPDGEPQAGAFILLAVGVALLLLTPTVLWSTLRRWDEAAAEPRRLEARYVLVAAIAGLTGAAAWMEPLSVPLALGSLTVLAIALALVALICAELSRLSEIKVPPKGLTMLGFRRLPVFLILGGWFVAAAQLDDGTYHFVRTAGTLPPAMPTVGQLWHDWMTANCVENATEPVPLTLVSTEGGGIRAAYWTGSVLTDLLGGQHSGSCATATPASRVFAISGISGGSLGAVSWMTRTNDENWYVDALSKPDSVAVPLSAGLLQDLPRALLGYPGKDRAEFLELAWERHRGALRKDYFVDLAPGLSRSGWKPVSLLTGTQVETGCRVNTSALRLTGRTALNQDCRSVSGPLDDVVVEVDKDGVQQRGPAAPITVDTRPMLCGQSIKVSTAALLSARFPYITPSGQLSCRGSRVSVVDGGYADGTGVAALLDLWAQLEPFVAEHNAGRGAGLVVPVFVHVDNHYQSRAALPPAPRTVELVAPPQTDARANKTADPALEQAARSRFGTGSVPGQRSTRCLLPGLMPKDGVRVLLAPVTRPGLLAPLAWTLSRTSRDDLDQQRMNLFEPKEAGARLRDLLAGRTTLDCSRA